MTTAHDSPDSAEISPPQDDLATRKHLGPYELKRKLGQGGMGAVYLAVDVPAHRQVALKILPREKASNPQLVKRFKAEAQNAGQLTHDNIVSVYGAGEADGYLYIALEFVDGIDVHDLVERRGVLPVKRSIDIIKQVARALQHAAEQGIVHRDIKPANLLVRRDGMVKLADMGLARAVDESFETGITRAGTTVGTVDYMSPEQARNSKAADVRSDIYSLGCTWYHMLTGSPPFAEGSLTNKLHAHAKQAPPDPRDKNSHVPEGVVAVMQRMLAKNPDDRYQSATELLRDLEGALINKDAISRKILEAIEDESFRATLESDAPPSEVQVPPLDSGSSTYPVEMDWSDSVAEAQKSDSSTSAGKNALPRRHVERFEPDAVPDEPEIPSSAAPPPRGKASATRPPGASRRPPSAEDSQEVATPATSGKGSPGKSHAASKGSTRGARSRSVSLPPPKRPDETATNNESGSSGIVKFLLTSLAIGVGVSILVFLAYLAQNVGGAIAPLPQDGLGAPQGGMAAAPTPMPAPQEAPANDSPEETAANAALTEKSASESQDVAADRNGPASALANRALNSPLPGGVPAWVDAPLNLGSLPLFNVRQGPTVEAERRYGTLADALQKVPAGGARIVLYHDGPFDLTPFEFGNGILTFEAARGAHPRIRLTADPQQRQLPWLNIVGGTLLLQGVELAADAGTVPNSVSWTWVKVTDGQLYVRESHGEMTGQRDASTTVFHLAGLTTDTMARKPIPARCLIDQTIMRGSRLETLRLESPAFEAVVRDSLMISGAAPAIAVQSHDKAFEAEIRHLRLFRSTVSSHSGAFHLSNPEGATAIPLQIVLNDSLIATPVTEGQPAWIQLENWPAVKPRVDSMPPFRALQLAAQGTAVLGFHPLIATSPDPADKVMDLNGWKPLFPEASGIAFAAVNWPALGGDEGSAPLTAWALATLKTVPVALADPAHPPGCSLRKLGLSIDDALPVAAIQITPPRPSIPVVQNSTQEIDINRTDPGKVISSKDWGDGTLFVIKGSGQRAMSPVVVQNRQWRLQFRQEEGPPLVVLPKAGRRQESATSALFTLEGGLLEIEGGTFGFDARQPNTTPAWFLHAKSGSFSLRHCRVVMPLVTGQTRNQGIIRWHTPEDSQKAHGQLVDTLLVGGGTLISADLTHRELQLYNSALVTRQQAIQLHCGSTESATPAAMTAQNCTILAGTQLLGIESTATADAKPVVLNIAQRDCIWGGLSADASQKSSAVLLTYHGAVELTRQVNWREDRCGYSPELVLYCQTDAPLTSSAQDFDQDWIQRWGAERIQHPLTGKDGILFEKTLPLNFVNVRPENLNLHQAARGRTWAADQSAIGVRTAALEPTPAPARASGRPKSGRAVPKIGL